MQRLLQGSAYPQPATNGHWGPHQTEMMDICHAATLEPLPREVGGRKPDGHELDLAAEFVNCELTEMAKQVKFLFLRLCVTSCWGKKRLTRRTRVSVLHG
jgi:hypothetical protein